MSGLLVSKAEGGAKAADGIIKGILGNIPHALNPAITFSGLNAVSNAFLNRPVQVIFFTRLPGFWQNSEKTLS